jgi:multisubunit Na+/H+ antiporter MnhB subunit
MLADGHSVRRARVGFWGFVGVGLVGFWIAVCHADVSTARLVQWSAATLIVFALHVARTLRTARQVRTLEPDEAERQVLVVGGVGLLLAFFAFTVR